MIYLILIHIRLIILNISELKYIGSVSSCMTKILLGIMVNIQPRFWTRQTRNSGNSQALVALPQHAKPDGLVVLQSSPDNTKKRAKAKGRPKKNHYAFQLLNKPDHYVSGKKEADEFKKNFKELIIKVSMFTDKEEFERHIVTRKQLTSSGSVGTKNNCAASGLKAAASNKDDKNDQDSDDACLLDDDEDTATEHFAVAWKTTTTSKMMAFLLRLMQANGKPAWIWKIYMLRMVMKYWVSCNTPSGPVMVEALKNMKYGSFPDENDRNQPKTLPYSPTKDKHILLPIHTMYTFVTIPYEGFGSSKEEGEWAQVVSRTLAEHFRTAMSSKNFRKTIEAKYEAFGAKLFSPTMSMNLPKYLAQAVVRISKGDSLNKLLITSEAADIMSVLYDNRLSKPKYPFVYDKDTEDDESGSDNSSDSRKKAKPNPEETQQTTRADATDEADQEHATQLDDQKNDDEPFRCGDPADEDSTNEDLLG
jgi:hypothetical protein